MNNRINAREIIYNEIRHAIELLNYPEDPHFIVHEVRKSFKKIRAYLRLVREHVDFKAENEFYRDLALKISEIRDLTSSMEAMDALRENVSSSLPQETFEQVQTYLDRLRKEKSIILFNKNKVLNEMSAALHGKLDEVSSWEITPTPTELNEQFHDSILKVKTTGQKAITAGDTETYHEWRKKVKHLRYQVEFLTGHLIPMNETLNLSLHRLSDFIGWDHDLAVLEALIREQKVLDNQHQEEQFYSVIRQRRQELKEQAIRMKENELPELMDTLQ